MFIEQAYRSLHEGWRYLVGTLLILAGWMLIGQIPLTIVLLVNILKKEMNGIPSSTYEMVAAAGIDSNLFIFLMLFSFAVGLLTIYLVAKYLHKQSFKKLTTTRKKTDWKRILLSFGLVSAYLIISTAIDYYTHPENYEVQFQLVPFLILFVISIIFVPLQTSFEEYLFRGYLMQGLGIIVKNRWFPLLVTSVIFGSLHFFNPEVTKFGPWIMLYYIGTGLFLGVLTLMDEGMELSLGFHAANNLITILLVTADWTAFQSNSILKDITEPDGAVKELIVSLLILYPLFLLIFARKYKWSNWKEKLTGRIIRLPKSDDDIRDLIA